MTKTNAKVENQEKIEVDETEDRHKKEKQANSLKRGGIDASKYVHFIL